MLYVALLLEWIIWILSPIVKIETTFTYFRIWILSYHRSNQVENDLQTQFLKEIFFPTDNRIFNISKAKRLLGYKPKVGLIEGIDRLVNWVKKEKPEWMAAPSQKQTKSQ